MRLKMSAAERCDAQGTGAGVRKCWGGAPRFLRFGVKMRGGKDFDETATGAGWLFRHAYIKRGWTPEQVVCPYGGEVLKEKNGDGEALSGRGEHQFS